MLKQQIQYSNALNQTQDELIHKNQISHRLRGCCMLVMKLSFLMREFPQKYGILCVKQSSTRVARSQKALSPPQNH